jgi:hypothetical protein
MDRRRARRLNLHRLRLAQREGRSRLSPPRLAHLAETQHAPIATLEGRVERRDLRETLRPDRFLLRFPGRHDRRRQHGFRHALRRPEPAPAAPELRRILAVFLDRRINVRLSQQPRVKIVTLPDARRFQPVEVQARSALGQPEIRFRRDRVPALRSAPRLARARPVRCPRCPIR